MHTFPMSSTGDEEDTGGHCRGGWEAGKSHRESSEVLKPALVRAWCLSEFCHVFPSVFVTESR